MENTCKIVEIKFGGFGGQGIILAGIITGKAAAIYDGRHACLIKSYGPEARGGSCSTQVIISESRILYPYVVRPDVLVILSQEAYNRFTPALKPDGVLLYESDFVKPVPEPKTDRQFSIPATHFAEELGKKVVTNIIMLGFFAAVSQAVSTEAMSRAIQESVPSSMKELNLKAYEKGFEYGINLLYHPPIAHVSEN